MGGPQPHSHLYANGPPHPPHRHLSLCCHLPTAGQGWEGGGAQSASFPPPSIARKNPQLPAPPRPPPAPPSSSIGAVGATPHPLAMKGWGGGSPDPPPPPQHGAEGGAGGVYGGGALTFPPWPRGPPLLGTPTPLLWGQQHGGGGGSHWVPPRLCRVAQLDGGMDGGVWGGRGGGTHPHRSPRS